MKVKLKAIVGSTSPRRSVVVRNIGSNCKWIPVQRLTLIWRNNFIENEDLKYLRTNVIKLENETQKLRAEVDRIMMLIRESKSAPDVGQCRVRTERLEESAVMSKARLVASPFRPPPPPPLPPSPMKSTKCLIVKVKPKTEWERDHSFLEELSKRPPKLRHVELSPGGRPVKVMRSPAPIHDTCGLSSVLMKRYIALHTSPRMSLDHCGGSPALPF